MVTRNTPLEVSIADTGLPISEDKKDRKTLSCTYCKMCNTLEFNCSSLDVYEKLSERGVEAGGVALSKSNICKPTKQKINPSQKRLYYW